MIAEELIAQIPVKYPSVTVDKYVVMPNHIHMILVVEPGGTNATVVIGQYKSQVSKEIHKIDPKRKIWQTSFHDHGIRNYRQYQHIREYIETNPMRWKEDCFFVQ
jgi:REP element-mobilizing transposase RayT